MEDEQFAKDYPNISMALKELEEYLLKKNK